MYSKTRPSVSVSRSIPYEIQRINFQSVCSRARAFTPNYSLFNPAIDRRKPINQTSIPHRSPSPNAFRFVFHRTHPIYISVSLVAKRTHDEPLHVFPLMLTFVTTTTLRRYDDNHGWVWNQSVTLASPIRSTGPVVSSRGDV